MDRIEEQAYVYANQSLPLAFVLLSFSFSLSFSFFLSIDHLDAEEKPKKYHTKNGSKRTVVVTSAHVLTFHLLYNPLHSDVPILQRTKIN